MAETATAAAKEDTGRKWEQKKVYMCSMCAITLFVCQIIIIYIYLEYFFILGVKMNFDKNFREIDNTNIYVLIGN